METQAYESAAGMKLLRDARIQLPSDIFEKRGERDGSNLGDFNVVGLKDVSAAVDRLPRAEMAEVMARDGGGAYDAWRVIRNAETKAPYGFTSPEYAIGQHAAALSPVLDVVQEFGLNVAAQFSDPMGTGKIIKSRFLLSNPEQVFTIYGGPDERLALILRAESSHALGTIKYSADYLRGICTNLGILKEFVESISLRHTATLPERLEATRAWYTDKLLPAIPGMQDLFSAALAQPTDQVELSHALLGAGLPVRHLDALLTTDAAGVTGLPVWEPSWATAPTLWSGYNAATGFLNHSNRFKTADRRETLLESVGGLLTDFSGMVKAGKVVAADLQAKRDEQMANKAAKVEGTRVSIPLIVGVIN